MYGQTMDPMWLVLQCESCGRAFGRQSLSKSIACPLCNHSDAKVLSRHLNAKDASKAVSLANVPPEIRTQLSSWMDQQPQVFDSTEESSLDGSGILAEAENEDGLISLESLRKALFSAGVNIDAEGFAERASAEGELMQVGPNCWKRA